MDYLYGCTFFVFCVLLLLGVSILSIYVLVRFIRYLASQTDEKIFY